MEMAGQWGDSFGPFNALFTALGFAALMGTLHLQRKALREQQREEHYQRFDTTFFELLRLFREARSAIRFTHGDHYYTYDTTKYEREDAFREMFREITFLLEGENITDGKYVGAMYETKVFRRYESRLGPYYRLLYTILNRISGDTYLSTSQKEEYGNLLRSQMTGFEAAMAGINALSPISKDLKIYVEEFRLLKYLPDHDIVQFLKKLYPPETFSGRPD